MCELSRRLYYYFGRNSDYDYVATKMASAVLTGDTCSGKTTFIESMLVRLIQESNPRDIDIYLYDCKGTSFQGWLTGVPDGKVFPHIRDIVCSGVNGDASDAAVKTLKKLCANIQQYLKGNLQPPKSKSLCIIDEFTVICACSKLRKDFFDCITYILENGDEFGVYVLVASQFETDFANERFINRFPIRICTPTSSDELASDLLLGNNCAAKEENPHGVVWVKTGARYPVRLYVPFYPRTWIKKFVRVFSVYPEA